MISKTVLSASEIMHPVPLSDEDQFRQLLKVEQNKDHVLKRFLLILPYSTFRTIYKDFLIKKIGVRKLPFNTKSIASDPNIHFYKCVRCGERIQLRANGYKVVHTNIEQTTQNHYFCKKICKYDWIEELLKDNPN